MLEEGTSHGSTTEVMTRRRFSISSPNVEGRDGESQNWRTIFTGTTLSPNEYYSNAIGTNAVQFYRLKH